MPVPSTSAFSICADALRRPRRTVEDVPSIIPKRRLIEALRPAASLVRTAFTVLLLLIGGATEPSFAQSSSDGSLYSRFGIGELQSFSSSQGDALGQSSFALHSLNYLNVSNPGTWADQVLTRASAGFTYQNIRITDAANARSQLASGYLNGVQFGLPLYERRLGIVLAFVPYSRVSYSVVNRGNIYPDAPTADTVAYVINFTGSGGLQQVVGGLGYRFNRYLSAGVSVNGIFGIIDNGRRTSFIQSGTGSQYAPTDLSTSTRLHGFTATWGAYLSTRGVFGADDFIGVGAAFTLPTPLTGERVNTLGQTLNRDTLGTTIDGNVDLPWRLGAGVSYQTARSWTISAGGEYAPWTDFRSTLSFPGYEPGMAETLMDRWKVGGGVEFRPAGADLLASYVERIGYRLGASYDRSYIVPEEGEELRTVAGTTGLSLPTMMSGTRLDVNIQVGTRGKTEGILVRDVFYRLSVGVNIGERWFQTPKLR